MRDHARAMLWLATAVAVFADISAGGGRVQAEDPNSALNPYHVVEHWAKLPDGRVWGQAIGVDIDRDGTSLRVFDRCGGKTCEGSNIAPISKIRRSRPLSSELRLRLVQVAAWTIRSSRRNGLGYRRQGPDRYAIRSDRHLLMTLGRPGVAGNGPDQFNSPSDVLVAPNRDIFVADGHGDFPVPKTNDRIVKYSKDGKFIKTWGHHGSGQGEFDVTHGLAIDSAGRLFVADRATTASRSSIRMENS